MRTKQPEDRSAKPGLERTEVERPAPKTEGATLSDKEVADIRANAAFRSVVDNIHAAVNQEYNVLGGPGASTDLSKVYIDSRLQQVEIQPGKNVSPAPFLAVHEISEAYLMEKLGWSWQMAHQVATAEERRAVEAAGGD